MKVTFGLKSVLYATTAILFVTGATYFVLDRFFKLESEFGAVPRYAQILSLHFHGIVSIWFMILFGYFYSKHIEPSRRGLVKRKSGYSLLFAMVFLIVTVPGLYYVGDEKLKAAFVFAHTYVGLLLPVPFLVHLFTRVIARPVSRATPPRTETSRYLVLKRRSNGWSFERSPFFHARGTAHHERQALLGWLNYQR